MFEILTALVLTAITQYNGKPEPKRVTVYDDQEVREFERGIQI